MKSKELDGEGDSEESLAKSLKEVCDPGDSGKKCGDTGSGEVGIGEGDWFEADDPDRDTSRVAVQLGRVAVETFAAPGERAVEFAGWTPTGAAARMVRREGWYRDAGVVLGPGRRKNPFDRRCECVDRRRCGGMVRPASPPEDEEEVPESV